MATLKDKSVSSIFGSRELCVPKDDGKWVSSKEYIGLEIETENTLIKDKTLIARSGWTVHRDGSLKVGGLEFVFDKPRAGSEITASLDGFFARPPSVTFDSSARAGIHIHINWSDGATLSSIYRLIALMYCIEPAIFEMVDLGRKYCGYCAPLTELTDANIRTVMTTESASHMITALKGGGGGNRRYFGTNLLSLFKHGTVEFRYFPSVNDREKVETWINMVMLIKQFCVTSDMPTNALIDALSTEEGIIEILQSNFSFGDIGNSLISNLDLRAAANRMTIFSYLINTKEIAGPFLTPSRAALRAIGKKYPDLAQSMEDYGYAFRQLTNTYESMPDVEGALSEEEVEDPSSALVFEGGAISAQRNPSIAVPPSQTRYI